VLLAYRQRSGRNLIVAPERTAAPIAARPQTRSALIKALAQAHRWQWMFDSGEHATVAELAAAERVNPSYASRVLRLTRLAPDLVEAILDGRQAAGVTLELLLRPFPVLWSEQTEALFRTR